MTKIHSSVMKKFGFYFNLRFYRKVTGRNSRYLKNVSNFQVLCTKFFLLINKNRVSSRSKWNPIVSFVKTHFSLYFFKIAFMNVNVFVAPTTYKYAIYTTSLLFDVLFLNSVIVKSNLCLRGTSLVFQLFGFFFFLSCRKKILIISHQSRTELHCYVGYNLKYENKKILCIFNQTGLL